MKTEEHKRLKRKQMLIDFSFLPRKSSLHQIELSNKFIKFDEIVLCCVNK